METQKTAKNMVCVKQPSVAIADQISQSITPIVAEKLSTLPSLVGAGPGDMRFLRKRITVEFFYEVTPDNRWGDFVKWNIMETTVNEKTQIEHKAHFPDTE